jgi:hypothetical protein
MAPIPILKPLLGGGVAVFPGLVAEKQETLIMKRTREHWTRESWDVTFPSPTGGRGTCIMKVDALKSHLYAIIDTAGRELCQIHKESHPFRPNIYKAKNGSNVLWELKIEKHSFRSTKYCKLYIHIRHISANHPAFIISPETNSAVPMAIQTKVQGQKMGLLLSGQPVATIHAPSMHLRREDHINVAKGMDMVVATGFAVALYDKQKESENSAVGAAGGAAGGGGGC